LVTATKPVSKPKAATKPVITPKAVTKPVIKPKAVTKMQPLSDRVVIRANDRDEMTASGIVLPDTAKEKPQEGTVIAVGPGRLNEKGVRVALEVKSGDTVLFARYAGTEVKSNGEELLILKESDVLAVLK
jgi:chaperonin GroES